MAITHQYDSAVTDSVAGDTAFRAWATAIHNLLTGIGLTDESATGQINLATVAQPGSTNGKAGFKVYRLNDGKTEIYIRVDFGTAFVGTAPDIRPSLWVRAGTTHNGSGTLGGQLSTEMQSSASSPAATGAIVGARAVRLADGEGFVLLHASEATSAGTKAALIGVERHRDPTTGAPTADGFDVFRSAGGQNSRYESIPIPSGSNITATSQFGIFLVPTNISQVVATTDSDQPVQPIFMAFDGWRGLRRSGIYGNAGTIAQGTIVEIPMPTGETVQWIAINTPGSTGHGTNARLLIPITGQTPTVTGRLPILQMGGGSAPPTTGQLFPRGKS